jgi:hypothetical protein
VSEKRPGQELMRFYMPEGLKERYKRLCSIKGVSMSEDLVAYIERELEENVDLLKIVENKLSEREP